MLIKPPCNRKCVNKKYWTKREMPFVSQDTKNWRAQLNTVLVCLTCIHFVEADNYIYEDRK